MAQFFPESSLLDHIYVPFYKTPVKRVEDCNYFNYLEVDSNNITSIINLSTDVEGETKQIIPFIDISKYDQETKDWFWMDASGFPYRLNYNGDWYLSAMWPINNTNINLSINPKNLSYTTEGRELGFYVETTAPSQTMYIGSPIIVTIEGRVLKDTTIYGGENSTTGLTKTSPELNPEFYYDSITNKIYTNQNLIGFDPSTIKIHFYESNNEVSVKCRMSSNAGGPAYYTPIVDYYIVKLNGQYLRG